jgi:hypothetical protein
MNHPSLHDDGLLSARSLLRSARHRAASPQSQPLHVPLQWLFTSSGKESLPPAGTNPARPSLLRRCGRTTEINVQRRVRPAKKEILHGPPMTMFTRLRRPLIAGEAR